jgi:hypothetical protein
MSTSIHNPQVSANGLLEVETICLSTEYRFDERSAETRC